MGSQWLQGFETGSAGQRGLLGGKGANLAEMTRIGLPVPPGFTVTTDACRDYQSAGRKLPDGLWPQITQALQQLETQMGKRLGDDRDPLLVSVRSGAAVSMPGMMDTVLNLGLNRRSVAGLAERTNDPRFAWDCLRRFIQMFSHVVLGLEMHAFELMLGAARRRSGAANDAEIPVAALQQLVADYEAEVLAQTRAPFPEDPLHQLQAAVCAVFDSWANDRAVIYRQLHQISDSLGTAVNIQAMVFGNMGPTSGTGVAFTRDPVTGENKFYGEYLINAQGEDVVAGIRTPGKIADLAVEMPAAYAQLAATCQRLERHYGDMQDIEFTIENHKLYMLQCRSAKRPASAALRIAVDMANEGILTREQAVMRITPTEVEHSMHSRLADDVGGQLLATGQAASPGAASGRVVFDAETAVAWEKRGDQVVLVRPETTPDDLAGMIAARGFVTSRGGTTCHAAIVARGMGKPCVVGCDALQIDLIARTCQVGSITVREGDVISLDGGDGRIVRGDAPVLAPEPSTALATILLWADEFRTLRVRANADNPVDAAKARENGAEGIGLCRTEHMFGQGGHHPERMAAVQRMIAAETTQDRLTALDALRPMQEHDFVGIFRAMAGLPVTIRLLDPPLHEFLPTDDQIAEIAVRNPGHAEALRKRKGQLHETNPMLGFRGVRLGIVYPEIYEMQIAAILAAAATVAADGVTVLPEIMIPLVGDKSELVVMRNMVTSLAAQYADGVPYLIGTMIELPRAALVANELAEIAEFFSFGTNDLTQTTWGYSRDDAEGGFLGRYLGDKLLDHNPFVVLDRKGVGKLIEIAVERGRATRPQIKIGICGEHGGEPNSIAFCHGLAMQYVSCSPNRVPVARLAAAQAALAARGMAATGSTV